MPLFRTGCELALPRLTMSIKSLFWSGLALLGGVSPLLVMPDDSTQDKVIFLNGDRRTGRFVNGTSGSDTGLGEHENAQQIEMCPQQTLRITLSEVRSAGFRWILHASKQSALSLLTDSLVPPVGQQEALGCITGLSGRTAWKY